jgi:pyruvate dehydrogenase E2 component (dihydrolipoamide acetyltransferase)
MAEVILMPRISPTMTEGVIATWLKKVGDPVKSGDILCEVETDKATMELESFQNGTLLYIGVEQGMIQVDAILAILGKPGEDISALLAGAAAPAAAAAAPVAEAVPAAASQQTTAVVSQDGRQKASPLARSMAKETGVDINAIKGSGDDGRIVRRDVEAALTKSGPAVTTTTTTTTKTAAPAPVAAPVGASYDVPVSQMRKVIARRLSESLFTAPHFYLTAEINMDGAAAARTMINDMGGAKISYNDLVVKACALALRKHPVVNSSWLGEVIRFNHEINIGVAVAIEDGLVVPVVRNADFKSLSDINAEVKDKAGRAKDKKLGLDEMQGNTFTISNLGMFDIDEFTAIINPPDSCILAVGSIIEKPIVKDGAVVVGKMMKVTLSCDHRSVDGASGAQFLQTLRTLLENPVRMLV